MTALLIGSLLLNVILALAGLYANAARIESNAAVRQLRRLINSVTRNDSGGR